MRIETKILCAMVGALGATSVFAQNFDFDQRLPQGLQAGQDPRAPQVFKQTCKNPPRSGVGLRVGSGAPDTGPMDYKVTAIPNVIAGGKRWNVIWKDQGNNADGIVGVSDGILIAQNNKGVIVKVGFDGSESYPYADTRTGGSLSMNVMGDLFVVERALYPSVTEVAPQRRVLADTFNGEPIHCLGGVINDLSADNRGGAYFTDGGVFYAAPDGTVTQYGQNLRTNGIILSPDEQHLYVTNGNELVVFDVQPNAALTNQRVLAKLPGDSRGDGLAVDSQGRVYVTAQDAGVHVISADGQVLGTIPTPRRAISLTFGGPTKHTLYVVGTTPENGWAVELLAINMEAQGYLGRPK